MREDDELACATQVTGRQYLFRLRRVVVLERGNPLSAIC
jgi:hypothetical protein